MHGFRTAQIRAYIQKYSIFAENMIQPSMKRSFCLTSLLLLFASAALSAQEQLPNMSLDQWEKKGKVWYATGWDSGNKGTSTLGKNVTEPEEEFVAVKGPGKKAARLRSEFVGVLGIGKFASACLYTGQFVKVIGTSGSQLSFGVPFKQRPASLHGYYAYTPGIIDYAGKNMKSMLGQTDHGHIEIYVTVWDKPFIIDNTKDIALDPKSPDVIGYGVLDFGTATDGYVEFNIPIVYTSDATPTYIGIMSASSRWGSYFTGSTGSVLYLDELELRY